MQAVGGPEKLRFTIHSCSGEDSDFPVRELLYHSPQTRGWQSPRFCKFPQEIVLRLEKPCKIQQIQILAHEFKIPTKIEVFVGLGPTAAAAADAAPAAAAGDPAAAAAGAAGMRRLGYLSFDSNERSNHQARELKSVHVTVDALLVRLLVHRCHVNKLNIYNQVGVIALNLIGEPLPLPLSSSQPPPFLAVADGPPQRELPYYNRAAGEAADLALDLHVDAVTAARIKELVRAKEAAVAAEDYDEAKRLKGSIERLKVVGGKIAQLEARKRLAVEREDYDLAKALKADVEKLRLAGEAAAVGSPGPGGAGAAGPGAGGRDPDAVFNRVLGRSQSSQGHADGAGGEAACDEPGSQQQQQQLYGGGSSAALATLPEYGEPDPLLQQQQLGGFRGSSFKGAAAGVDASAAVQHTYQAYEDRPAVAKASYLAGSAAGQGGSGSGEGAAAGMGQEQDLIRADPSQVSAAAYFGTGPRSSVAAAGWAGGGGGVADRGRDGDGCGVPAPAGWPSDLPPPEPLPASSTKEAEPVVDVAGEFVAAAFFSRSWQLRDAAAAWVGDLVANGRLSGGPGVAGGGGGEQREVAKGLVRLAVKGLRDKVPQVYSSCLGLLQALLGVLASAGPGGSRDVAQAVESALPVLLERLSDSNPRLRDSAREALVGLAASPDSAPALRACSGQLCRPPKSQAAWRPVLAVLQLLQELVPLLGVAGAGAAAAGGAAGGFELGEVMEFVGRAFGNANAEVRGAALRVAVGVAAAAGPGGGSAVRRLLPRDINPKMLEQVDAALGPDTGGGGAVPAAQQQTTPARSGRAAAGAGGGRSAGKPAATGGHPNRQAAAAAAAAATTGPSPGGRQQQQQRQQQAAPPAPAAAAAAAAYPDGEDPAPFVAELAAREAQYGPRHPAVAESCSNLAILYNQRGEYGAALPLYERALAIYEAVYGPDHEEVAHTLTDLAVLHLEQGHDAVGRPLLERAVAIQEAALGPDHPDVLAIRDVLASE